MFFCYGIRRVSISIGLGDGTAEPSPPWLPLVRRHRLHLLSKGALPPAPLHSPGSRAVRRSGSRGRQAAAPGEAQCRAPRRPPEACAALALHSAPRTGAAPGKVEARTCRGRGNPGAACPGAARRRGRQVRESGPKRNPRTRRPLPACGSGPAGPRPQLPPPPRPRRPSGLSTPQTAGHGSAFVDNWAAPLTGASGGLWEVIRESRDPSVSSRAADPGMEGRRGGRREDRDGQTGEEPSRPGLAARPAGGAAALSGPAEEALEEAARPRSRRNGAGPKPLGD